MAETKSPSYGNRLGFWFFHTLIRIGGPYPAYTLLAFILPYYLLVRGSARRSAAFYLRHRFPGIGPVRLFLASCRHLFHFGRALIDQACMGILDRRRFHVDFPGQSALYTRSKEGRGMVLLTTHAGNWMTAMATLDRIEVPVNLLLDRERSEGRHFFDLSGDENGFRFIPPTGFMGGMVESTNALRRGEIVSIMGDRIEGSRTLYLDFLGEKAPFPVTPYYLVAATGADLVVLLTARTGSLSFSIEAHCVTDGLDLGKIPRDELMRTLAGRYRDLLENYLAIHPYMWFNFFDFWHEEAPLPGAAASKRNEGYSH